MPAGLDGAGHWLVDNVAGVRAPLSIRLIAAGRSNLTYRVEDAQGRTVILRRPPARRPGVDTAHNIQREHRVLLALSRLGLMVPRPLGLCTDPSVVGVDFLVMEHVDGHILRTPRDAEVLGVPARGRAGAGAIEALLAVHELDVDAAGLADLSRHSGYVERQLRRWSGQLATDSPLVPRSSLAVLADTHRRLSAAVPAQQRVSVVHGDFRLDNLVIGPDGTVVSILDWELCTLGDPLADLGILLASWAQADDLVLTLAELEPTRAEGFVTRESLIAAYAAGSSLDLADIGYYYAFGLWKLACVLHGVRVRYETGSVAGDLAGADQLGQIVDRLAGAAATAASTL